MANCSKINIYLTGWIGIPIHEIGHALFCLIFHHKIVQIKLFTPNNSSSLGLVHHTFKPNSRFQKFGILFIGIGPIAFGSFIIYVLMSFLVPNFSELLFSFPPYNSFDPLSIKSIIEYFIHSFNITYSIIFQFSNYSNISFWIFLYFSFCIASHMELSAADLKNMYSGLISLIIGICVFNIILLALNFNPINVVYIIIPILTIFTGILMYALVISTVNFLVSCLIAFLLLIKRTNY